MDSKVCLIKVLKFMAGQLEVYQIQASQLSYIKVCWALQTCSLTIMVILLGSVVFEVCQQVGKEAYQCLIKVFLRLVGNFQNLRWVFFQFKTMEREY